MKKTVLAAISALYAAFGLVLVAAYLPQLLSIWRSRTGAADVSLWTWGIWSASATVTLLYAGLVVRDPGFAMISAGNLVGCYSITGAVLIRRHGAKRAVLAAA